MKKKAKPSKNTSSNNTSKSTFKFHPTSNNVLVKPEGKEEKTMSGIIIPQTSEKKTPESGIIVAIGPGKHGDDNELIPVSVKVGDHVVFEKYSGQEITIDEQEYFIVSESKILGTY